MFIIGCPRGENRRRRYDTNDVETFHLPEQEKREVIGILNVSEYEWIEWGLDMFALKKNLLSRHVPHS
jgi:hypothetical protein